MRIKMKFVRILRISFYVLSFTFYVITPSPSLALENNSIVINEIAYRGTQASGYDEWIELFNSSNDKINLNGWELLINSKSIPLLGTVQPQSYLLLERSDDQTISDITADQIFTGGLTDSESVLQLKNNGRIVDQVSKWHVNLGQPEENFSDRSSMERISPSKGGDLQTNWQINNQQTINGLDADGSKIFGTPRSKNSPPSLITKNKPSTTLINKPEKKIEKSKVVSKTTAKKNKSVKKKPTPQKIKPLFQLAESPVRLFDGEVYNWEPDTNVLSLKGRKALLIPKDGRGLGNIFFTTGQKVRFSLEKDKMTIKSLELLPQAFAKDDKQNDINSNEPIYIMASFIILVAAIFIINRI